MRIQNPYMKGVRLILLLTLLVFTTAGRAEESGATHNKWLSDVLATPRLDSRFVYQLETYQAVRDSVEMAQAELKRAHDAKPKEEESSAYYYVMFLYFLFLGLVWAMLRPKLTEEDVQQKKYGHLRSYHTHPRLVMMAYLQSVIPYFITAVCIEEFLEGNVASAIAFTTTFWGTLVGVYLILIIYLFSQRKSYYAVSDQGIHRVVHGEVKERYNFQDISDVQMTLQGKSPIMTITLVDGRVLRDWNPLMYRNIRAHLTGKLESNKLKNGLKEALPVILLLVAILFLVFTLASKSEETAKFDRMTYANGEVYEGRIVGDKCMGLGRQRWKETDYYVGDVKENLCDGYGIRFFEDSVYHCGRFSANLRSGYGIAYLPSRHIYYLGLWQKDFLTLNNIGFVLNSAYQNFSANTPCVYHFNDSVFVIANTPQAQPYKIVREVIKSVRLATRNQQRLDSIMHDFPDYQPLPDGPQFHMPEFLSQLVNDARKIK